MSKTPTTFQPAILTVSSSPVSSTTARRPGQGARMRMARSPRRTWRPRVFHRWYPATWVAWGAWVRMATVFQKL
jgi:hypothetical protein